jgi:hypothetical protein
MGSVAINAASWASSSSCSGPMPQPDVVLSGSESLQANYATLGLPHVPSEACPP